MESFFSRLHERRETLKRDELSKRDQWREDDRRVRNGFADFKVKYLGCVEVNDSKGIHVLESALRTLRFGDHETPTRFSFFKNESKSMVNLFNVGELRVSADKLCFVDNPSKDVLVESPIDKISFCGPLENGKYFGYICRENLHWKWICHCFKSTEDHADRINNAVGCAFRICLEKKHKARMERQWKVSSTAPPPPAPQHDSLGGSVVAVGTINTPARTTATSESSSTVSSTGMVSSTAAIHITQPTSSQMLKVQETAVDLFDLAWKSKTTKDARI